MTTSTPLLGTRIGAYEVQTILGSGGMATVYRGFDHNLHRPVAIKVLSNVAAQPDYVQRFRQEARLAARLRHPNIVRVYDLIEQDGVMYMIQELLPGQTLTERLVALSTHREMMSRQEIMTVMQQLAAALDAAHLAGIIHRDVKPSNILYNDDGALVLTDFGIAKSLASDTTKTLTGMVLGTPAYISPEQARGEAITPASDIYALGVVLYILISGQPPFDGLTPLEIVIKHLNEPPPLIHTLRPKVPPMVDVVLQCALAKRPGDRFMSASQFAQALVMAWPEPGLALPADLLASSCRLADPLPLAQVRERTPVASMPGVPAALAESPRPITSVLRQSPSRAAPFLALLLIGAMLVGGLLAGRGQEEILAQSAAPRVATEIASGPLAGLREILATSADPAIHTSLDAAEQALSANDPPNTIQALATLQRQILAARQQRSLSEETMRVALAAIQELALRNNLRMPLQIGSRSGHRLYNLLYYAQSDAGASNADFSSFG